VIHSCPQRPMYCLSSSQTGQAGGGFEDGENWFPQVTQM
jgi:hypothetical protein